MCLIAHPSSLFISWSAQFLQTELVLMLNYILFTSWNSPIYYFFPSLPILFPRQTLYRAGIFQRRPLHLQHPLLAEVSVPISFLCILVHGFCQSLITRPNPAVGLGPTPKIA